VNPQAPRGAGDFKNCFPAPLGDGDERLARGVRRGCGRGFFCAGGLALGALCAVRGALQESGGRGGGAAFAAGGLADDFGDGGAGGFFAQFYNVGDDVREEFAAVADAFFG